MPTKKEGVVGVCGMGLPDTGARVEPVPIIHLLVLGEGDRLKPEWRPLALPTSPLPSPLLPSPPLPSPPPSSVLQCSLPSVLSAALLRPHLREGMGVDCLRGRQLSQLLFTLFFFLQPTPHPILDSPQFPWRLRCRERGCLLF